jgi:hypothetical protein
MKRAWSAWTLGVAVTMVATPSWAQTFGDDVAFLKERTAVVVLADAKTGARVLVCPDLQGRVRKAAQDRSSGGFFKPLESTKPKATKGLMRRRREGPGS